MSDVAKWALLVAIIVTAVGVVLSLPIIGQADITAFTTALSDFVAIIAEWVTKAKSLVLYFVPDGARPFINALIIYSATGWIALYIIRLTLKLYHWIFK